MPDYSFHIYDTALFGVTAGTTHTLFQVPQGGDATHVMDFTNMRGAGQFPVNEKFTIRKIMVASESELAEADVTAWYRLSYLKLLRSNHEDLISPLLPLIAYAGFGGHFTQAAAANRALIGRMGEGYVLTPNISIDGGDAFKIEVFQGVALSAANQRIKVILEGILNSPT